MKIDFTEIFCHVDDFFRELDAKTNFITDKNNKPGCKSRLNRSVSMSIKSVPVIITKSVPVAAKNFNS